MARFSNLSSVEFAAVRPVPESYDRCVRSNVETIDVALAKKQHREYCRTLQELGLKLVWVKGDNSLPDSCFVEDTAVIVGEKAVICNMSVKSRANEVNEVAKVFGDIMETHFLVPPAFMDGGDVIKVEDKILVGLSTRTNLHAVVQLRTILGPNTRVVPVKIRNVLHLKSACTYIGKKCAILSKGFFNVKVLQGYKKIFVPKVEAYSADCLAVNDTVLIAKGYPKAKKLVAKEGFAVKELEMSEFKKGGGALTCLSIIW